MRAMYHPHRRRRLDHVYSFSQVKNEENCFHDFVVYAVRYGRLFIMNVRLLYIVLHDCAKKNINVHRIRINLHLTRVKF